MNVLSLFDGMSCGQIALERANIKTDNYFASEIDKYAIKITQKNYPNTIQLGDVTKWREWDLPKIDMIIGGSPCQGFSNAGQGLNFEDPRSKLFFEFVDILKFYKPKYFLLENVRMKKEWKDIISDYLNVDPIMINSSLVSAQNRKRFYWTNIEKVEQPSDKNIYWKDIQEINANNVFYYTEQSLQFLNNKKRAKKYFRYRITDKIKMQMLEASHYKGYSNQRCFGIEDIKGDRYISPIECERLQTVPDNYTEGVSKMQRYKMLGNGWTVDIIAHIFSYLSDEYKIQ